MLKLIHHKPTKHTGGLSMENIILQLIKKFFSFSKNMNFNDIIAMTTQNASKFASNLVIELFQYLDNEIMQSDYRKNNWKVIKIDDRTITTVLGKITFSRRYYQNKHTDKYAYLLDEALEIIPRQRLDVSLEAKLAEFANDLSFEKAGKMVSDEITISKQTVKKIIAKFAQRYEENYDELESKKETKVLFIEADEDHVSLQKDSKNNVINKLIYVHEGKIQETKSRNFLHCKHVFSSNLKSPEDMWINVYDYIYSKYDITKLEKIFILGDGANWIKTGLEWIDGSEFVLDSFHLNKSILIISGGESKEVNKQKYEKLKKLIYSKEKDEFNKYAKELIEEEKSERTRKRKDQQRKYILNQWKWIVSNLDNKEKYRLGCSAEGHVSHILASRMSSRPLSWSRDGLEAITKLRIALENGITRMKIYETLIKANKEIAQEKYKPVKHLKRIKSFAMETLGNIPVLSKGKVSQLQITMSGLR
jgi:hypothetical protein